jgi:hypothetical protein
MIIYIEYQAFQPAFRFGSPCPMPSPASECVSLDPKMQDFKLISKFVDAGFMKSY